MNQEKERKDDRNYALKKAGLASIPYVGGAAAELFGQLVTPPLEKRREAWIQDIGNRLKKLEEQGHLDLATLPENDVFIDVVMHTTQVGLRTSQLDKIEYLKNALLNAATDENLDESKAKIFVNLIDTFTIWHIRILNFINNPEHWYNENDKAFPNYVMASLHKILIEAYPELSEDLEMCNIIWGDLERAGLHNTGSLQTSMSGDGLRSRRTTAWGKEFLDFISSPSV